MAILTPPPAAPQRGDRTTFANRVDAFITWLINFVSELVSLVANLNSIAAGGAYAIPFVGWGDSNPAAIAAGPGRLVIPLSPQSSGTGDITFNVVDLRGRNIKSLFDSIFNSNSTVKAYLTLTAQNDPTRWITYRVNAWAYDAQNAIGALNVTGIGGSSDYPMAAGDVQIMQITRNGDKGDRGDKGDSATTAIIRVRDDRPAGTGGDAAVATTWATRTLNSTIWNNIAGASLSGNQITLPAGTYDYVGSAPAFQTNAHQMRLYNVTAGGAIDYGTNEFASSSTNVVTRSIVRGRITLAATTVIAMQHWASSAGSFGVASLTGTIQSYAELTIEKVA